MHKSLCSLSLPFPTDRHREGLVSMVLLDHQIQAGQIGRGPHSRGSPRSWFHGQCVQNSVGLPGSPVGKNAGIRGDPDGSRVGAAVCVPHVRILDEANKLILQSRKQGWVAQWLVLPHPADSYRGRADTWIGPQLPSILPTAPH